MKQNKPNNIISKILMVSLFIYLLLIILAGAGCSKTDLAEIELIEQLGRMNDKIDMLSEENEELKERINQQELQEAAGTGTEEEKIWYYINLFPDGSGDFKTIEEAVEAVSPGGTIYLNTGTYYPEINLEIDKPVNLIGAGMDKTCIIYNQQPNVVEFIGEGLLTINGISFERDGSDWGDVIWIKSGYINISDCSFSGATHFEKEEEGAVGGGMGILIWGDNTRGIIQSCIIEDSSVDGVHIRHGSLIYLIDNHIGNNSQYGASYWDGSDGIVYGNECYENGDSGISIRGQSGPKIIGNVSKNNGYSGIDYYGEESGVAVQNICFENSYHGISVGGQSQPKLLENICRDNIEVGIVFFENSGGFAISNECSGNEYGIYIKEDADPTLVNNTFTDNNYDISDKR